MMRPRVYISGAMTDGGTLSTYEIEKNIRKGVEAFKRLTDLGFACILPHLTIYLEWNHGVNLTHAEWMEIDRSLICGAEAVYRISESVGADEEFGFAMSIEVPVFTDLIAMCGHFQERLR